MSQVSTFARRLRRLEDRLRPTQRQRLVVLDVEVEPGYDEHGHWHPRETGEQYIYEMLGKGIVRVLHRSAADGVLRELVQHEGGQREWRETSDHEQP